MAGNEFANYLARKGSETTLTGSEPLLAITKAPIRCAVVERITKKTTCPVSAPQPNQTKSTVSMAKSVNMSIISCLLSLRWFPHLVAVTPAFGNSCGLKIGKKNGE